MFAPKGLGSLTMAPTRGTDDNEAIRQLAPPGGDLTDSSHLPLAEHVVPIRSPVGPGVAGGGIRAASWLQGRKSASVISRGSPNVPASRDYLANRRSVGARPGCPPVPPRGSRATLQHDYLPSYSSGSESDETFSRTPKRSRTSLDIAAEEDLAHQTSPSADPVSQSGASGDDDSLLLPCYRHTFWDSHSSPEPFLRDAARDVPPFFAGRSAHSLRDSLFLITDEAPDALPLSRPGNSPVFGSLLDTVSAPAGGARSLPAVGDGPPSPASGRSGDSPAPPCRALPCPALPCPALPCPALSLTRGRTRVPATQGVRPMSSRFPDPESLFTGRGPRCAPVSRTRGVHGPDSAPLPLCRKRGPY